MAGTEPSGSYVKPANGRNPYVGPRPFEQGEAIYGRDREISELYYLLSAERVVLFHSPSGAGKTSLIQAGLIPRLRPYFDVWRPTRLNLDPIHDEVDVSHVNRYVLSALQGLEEGVPLGQRRPVKAFADQSLTEYVAERPRRPGAPTSLMLIFDQFEEVLTVDPLARAVKRRFFDQLGELLHNPDVWALFVLREEYLAALDPYAQQVPTHLKNRLRLDLLDLKQAERAIVKPAEAAGKKFTLSAVKQMLHDLATVKSQQADGAFKDETGHHVEPMHLQVVCRRLWEQLSENKRTVDSEDLGKFGDVTEALAAYYSSSVVRIAGQETAKEREIREWFSEQLVTESGIRAQVVRGFEASGGLANKLVQKLLDAHLIRAEQRGGATWYELAHDRLLEPVQKDNAAWRQTHLSEVQHRASLWDRQGRLPGFLLEGKELTKAELWAEGESDLTGIERLFLEASRESRESVERERKQTQRFRRLAVGSMIVGIVAFVAGVVALLQWGRAVQQKKRAEDLARAAIAGGLLGDGNTTLGNLVALEVRDPAETPTAVSTLHKALVVPVEFTRLDVKERDSYVTYASFSPDSSLIFTAFGDSKPRIWSMETGQEIAKLGGHKESISAASFSPDGSRLVTGSQDGTARIWDVQTGELLVVLKSHTARVYQASFSPDGLKVLTVSSADGTARIWKSATGEELVVFRGQKAGVLLASFASGSVRVLNGPVEGPMQIWDVQASEEIATLDEEGWISAGSFSPDGSRIVLAGGATARIWDAQTGQKVSTLRGHTGGVNFALFSPDGSRLVTASRDETARIWDVQSGDEVAILHSATASRIGWPNASFSPDSALVALSLGGNAPVRIWKAQTGEQVTTLMKGEVSSSWTLLFSPDGSQLLTGSGSGTARIWSLQSGEEISKLEGHLVEILATTLSPSGAEYTQAEALATWLTSSSGPARPAVHYRDDYLRIRNAQTGKSSSLPKDSPLGNMGFSSIRVLAAVFSTDSARVLATSDDGTARIWDAQSGEEVALLRGHTSKISIAYFSPDGTKAITASSDGTMRVWHARTGEEIAVLKGYESGVSRMVLSPTGVQALAVFGDGAMRIWNIETGAEVSNLRRYKNDTFHAGSFSYDGSMVAMYPGRAGSVDFPYTARVWNPHTGEEIALLKAHTDYIRGVSFSIDGSRIVTSSDDGTARIWFARTGKEIAILKGHSDSVQAAVFSADGSRIVTVSNDKTARVWDAETGETVATFKGHTDRLLSASFSADDSRVATASLDGTARSWANSQDYPSFLQSRIRARTRLCLDADFRQSILGELSTEAERNVQVCERCVPVFFEQLGDAPTWEWKIFEEAWRVYRECLTGE